jgi:AcrR family transcriptional regulator
MEELILNKTRDLFFSFGLRSVSMDDVARQCGISKKTLYQHFADRQALVDAVADGFLSCHRSETLNCQASARNAVEEVSLQLQSPFALLAAVNYSFFRELEKYFPTTWQRILQYNNSTLRQIIGANLGRGIDEGLYRPELPIDRTVDIRLQQLRTALNPEGFSRGRPSSETLMRDLSAFYLYAICTEKGRKLIPKYFKYDDETASKKN